MTYVARTFQIPELEGISKDQIAVHLKLYEGYVKHANLINEQMRSLAQENTETNTFVMNELRRRFSFEFNGIRMHDYYFEQLEGGTVAANMGSPLADAVTAQYGTWNDFISQLHTVSQTRGVGWVIVHFDPRNRELQLSWVNNHEIGQLAGVPILLAIDMWEHAYMVDYNPSEKKSYVDAFLHNLNWNVVERRFLDEVV